MRRREFITLVGGAATWPLGVRAQQSAEPVIRYLHSGSPSPYAELVTAFRRGLSEAGFVERQNVRIEYRWAAGRYDQLPALAAELVDLRVAILVAQGGDPPVLAAKSATATIPIVFTSSSDPVKLGLVRTLNRPGGNVTGVWLYTSLLGTKRLELIRQLIPAGTPIVVLVNPDNPNAEIDTRDLQEAAHITGQPISFVRAKTEPEIISVFATLADHPGSALLVNTDPFFLARSIRVARCAQRGSDNLCVQREFVTAGGLISYGASLAEGYREVGDYVGRILKGEKPVDLPIIQPTKFEMEINLKTAKALGLPIPAALLATADDVIE